MEDKPEISEESQWQLDSRAFLWKVVWHWENLGTAIFGCAAVSLWLGRGYVIAPSIFSILANICFLIACFRAWRDERREKEKAIAALTPPIAGTWTREVSPGLIGVQEFYFDGKILSGTFKEGELDHEVKGTYDPATGTFTTMVERKHYRDASVPRNQHEVKYWLVGKDMYCYYSPKNAAGVPDRGFLYRKDTTPPWLGPRM